MKVSVVVPTLNEGSVIAATLRAVRTHGPACEIVVSDGGSTDATIRIARDAGAIVVASAPRGRASQMNAGAAAASGDVLLFLHADTMVTAGTIDAVRRCVSDGHGAGTFRLTFSDTASPLLRSYAWCTRLRAPSICFGDRGLFVTRHLFNDVEGFPEMPIFEDLEMVRRVCRKTDFAFLPNTVSTSARRFDQHGAIRQQVLNLRLWLGYHLGTDPKHLANQYDYAGP